MKSRSFDQESTQSTPKLHETVIKWRDMTDELKSLFNKRATGSRKNSIFVEELSDVEDDEKLPPKNDDIVPIPETATQKSKAAKKLQGTSKEGGIKRRIYENVEILKFKFHERKSGPDKHKT